MIVRPVNRSHGASRAAFTLLEVLIVVAIIVVLAGAGTLTFLKFQEGANEDVAYTKIKNIEKAAMAIQIRSGSPPQSLAEMTQATDGGRAAIDDVDALKDPWGKEFQYDPSGKNNGGARPDIWTTAPNGKTIGNWPGAR
jgi:prepilin-type N-terminal cleavage/methylation domain-containing protein